MKKHSCIFCGAPATLLCDAPMCRQCATLKSTMHICRRRRGGCVIETVDHCPACVANLPEHNRRIIHSPEQAATIRAAQWVRNPTDFQKWDWLVTGGGQQCLDL